MTVAELITRLQQMPQDADALVYLHGDAGDDDYDEPDPRLIDAHTLTHQGYTYWKLSPFSMGPGLDPSSRPVRAVTL